MWHPPLACRGQARRAEAIRSGPTLAALQRGPRQAGALRLGRAVRLVADRPFRGAYGGLLVEARLRSSGVKAPCCATATLGRSPGLDSLLAPAVGFSQATFGLAERNLTCPTPPPPAVASRLRRPQPLPSTSGFASGAMATLLSARSSPAPRISRFGSSVRSSPSCSPGSGFAALRSGISWSR